MSPNIWMAVHANHYGLHEKYSAGSRFSARSFMDPEGFHIAIKARKKDHHTSVTANSRKGPSASQWQVMQSYPQEIFLKWNENSVS